MPHRALVYICERKFAFRSSLWLIHLLDDHLRDFRDPYYRTNFETFTFARAVGLGRVTLGTGAVADTAGDCDALGAARTLLALRATGQHAFTVDDLVRWLALTLDAVALCKFPMHATRLSKEWIESA